MYVITFQKSSQRRLDPSVMLQQIQYISSRVLSGGRGRVWGLGRKVKTPELTAEVNGVYLYTAEIKLERISKRSVPDDVCARQQEVMLKIALEAGRSKQWTLPVEMDAADAERQPKRIFAPGDISLDLSHHFDHIYERENQIALVQSAVNAYTASAFDDRFHCVLYGPPACGKTEILRSFTKMLGSDAVLAFDATSTTKAGAEKTLLETESVPPFLLIEELEKVDENSLRWLLGILDHRAEIRKVNFRTAPGGDVRQVKLLCMATVNDMDLFKTVMDGALASRFPHKIYCPRPSRVVLTKILEREIARISGNKAWIKPALDWCINQEQTNDPRRVITVCLCGRDALLTGEYQKRLAVTMPPKDA